VPFFRTVAGSPALVARARAITSEVQGALAGELDRDPAFAGEPATTVAQDHRGRLERLFTALHNGAGPAS
jgi:hypothetical protein